ncbi:hypothetical protein LPJ73_008355 [Coemansia sp. RSA 2703]|nr:hypothetical protein LPJ73_008355 [Coemansia sp. RSA 2703]
MHSEKQRDLESCPDTEYQSEAERKLGIATLTRICLVVFLVYSNLFYFFHWPKLRSMTRMILEANASNTAISEDVADTVCRYIQLPTATPLSQTYVQIDWITTCRLDSTLISYTGGVGAYTMAPNWHSKYSEVTLVDVGSLDDSFHYRVTLYVKDGLVTRYHVHTGNKDLDSLPEAIYSHMAIK